MTEGPVKNVSETLFTLAGEIACALLIGAFVHAQVQSSHSVSISGSRYSPTTLNSQLRDRTDIPPRLPALSPDEEIFAVPREITSSKYEILLATKLPCEGGNACLYGSLQGSRSSLEPVDGNAIEVPIANGIVGQFTAAKCYAFCSQSYIRWKEKAVFYSIGIKAGKKGDLIKAARSCIDSH